jgi:hypothetical protein
MHATWEGHGVELGDVTLRACIFHEASDTERVSVSRTISLNSLLSKVSPSDAAHRTPNDSKNAKHAERNARPAGGA